MEQEITFELHNYPACFERYYVHFTFPKQGNLTKLRVEPAGSKLMRSLRANSKENKVEELSKLSCDYREDKHWCRLCRVKRSVIPSMLLSCKLGSSSKEQIFSVTSAANRLEDIAKRHDLQDVQVIEIISELESIVNEWNFVIYRHERTGEIISQSIRCNDLMDWYLKEWPGHLNAVNREIDILTNNRKGAWAKHTNSRRNAEVARRKAHTIWEKERKDEREITRAGKISESLSRQSESWSIDGKRISKKTIMTWLRLWKYRNKEAFRQGRAKNLKSVATLSIPSK